MITDLTLQELESIDGGSVASYEYGREAGHWVGGAVKALCLATFCLSFWL